MHGGLFSEDGVTLEDLRKIERNRQPPDSGRVKLQMHHQYKTVSKKMLLERIHFNTILHFFSQVPCVTSSGQIHSLRSVPTRPECPLVYIRATLSSPLSWVRSDFHLPLSLVQNGRSVSKRGVSCQFGPDVTERFLDQNKLDFIVRSHEVKAEGYEVTHSGKCITVFSAPNYWYVTVPANV